MAELNDLRYLVGILREALWPGDAEHDPEVVTPPNAHDVIAEAIRRAEPDGARERVLRELVELWRIEARHRTDKDMGQGYTNALEHCALDLVKALASQARVAEEAVEAP